MAKKYKATLVRGISHTLFGVGKFAQGVTVEVDEATMKKLATATETVTVTDGKGGAAKKQLPKFKFVEVGKEKAAADEDETTDETGDETDADESGDESGDESEGDETGEDGDAFDEDDEDERPAAKSKPAAKKSGKKARNR